MQVRVRRISLAIYWAALLVATHVPLHGELRRLTGQYDKALHGAAYFGLAVLVGLNFVRLDRWFVVLCGCAAADEILQQAVARRASVADWAADVVGVGAGLALVWLARNRLRGATLIYSAGLPQPPTKTGAPKLTTSKPRRARP